MGEYYIGLPNFRSGSLCVQRQSTNRAYFSLQASYIRQDGIQCLLTPQGKFLTGYTMLEPAIMNWTHGEEQPLAA